MWRPKSRSACSVAGNVHTHTSLSKRSQPTHVLQTFTGAGGSSSQVGPSGRYAHGQQETTARVLRDQSSRPGRSRQNRPVHRFLKKPAGSTGFQRSDCMNGLLSEPSRYSLWFDLLPVRPPVRSGPNNQVMEASASYLALLHRQSLVQFLRQNFNLITSNVQTYTWNINIQIKKLTNCTDYDYFARQIF